MPCTGTGTHRQLSASAGALIAVGEAHPDPTVTDHLAANLDGGIAGILQGTVTDIDA
jgi:hypothetical protein